MCGATVTIGQPLVWRCPNATPADRHHVLELVQSIAPLRAKEFSNPFLAFRRYLAWDGFAAAIGLDESARESMVIDLDDRIAAVAGTGFVSTPFARADALSDELGFGVDGGVWVKDETHNVAGSHKARHLFTILLHLVAAEAAGRTTWARPDERPPLAIASCGNAALAAATLAAAVDWPLQVFVPSAANPTVVAQLRHLGAAIVECPRRRSNAPGDPCIHRFREAVATGAIPFTVQGPENAWCLDGGRTLGWEMARHMEERVEGPPLGRLFVQVGGGALAASVTAGFRMSGITPWLHAVQTDSCAPLARAWGAAGASGRASAARHWSEWMWPWEHVGSSAADGILDDETYDWLPVVGAMAHGGAPVVVSEATVLEANSLAARTTDIDASHTGTAGLAGLLAIRGELAADERVAVVFSGVRR
ncbi:MAG: hypothetical protein RLZZ623_2661 [Actinomycetota bacterium]